MSFRIISLSDTDQLRRGLWIKKSTRYRANQNGITIGRHRAQRVIYISTTATKLQIATSSVQEFCRDAQLIYIDTRFEETQRKIYGGYFTASTNYVEKCTTADEVERNAQYYADHLEKWQINSDGVFEFENDALACYCTSKVKNETDRANIKFGDHIYVITKKQIVTTEHGIVIRFRHNRELGVIYFSEEKSRLDSTSIEEFADGRPIGVADYISKPAEEVVTLAMDFAQHPQKWRDDYHLNPSLRFAEYCKKKVTQPIPFYINFLKPGDHIFAKDDNECYRNHGIFIGGHIKQREVALFSKTNSFTSLDDFLRDRILYWCNNPLRITTASNVLLLPKDNSHERVGYNSHWISHTDLKPGDHIYVYRKLGLYQHHGIYIGIENGEHTVVHFNAPVKSKDETSDGEVPVKSKDKTSDGEVSIKSKDKTTDGKVPEKSKDKTSDGKVTTSDEKVFKIHKSSLKIFKGWSLMLRLVCYGADFNDMERRTSGTTQTLESLPPQEVVATAQYYAEHSTEWSEYNLIDNNCEMFALYCKTGIRITGRSQIQGYKLGHAKYKYFPDI